MADLTPGAGDVLIELDGKEHLLKPTLQACMAISKIGGGLNAAVARCNALDFDTICEVIIAGLALNPVQAKMVPEAVYKTGMIPLYGPCIEFITIVANGGRPVEDEDEEEAGADAAADPLAPASP